MTRRFPFLFFALTLAACVATTPAPAPAPVAQPQASALVPDEGLDSTLWLQTAAEYEALAHQAYGVADSRLDAALNDHAWTAAPEQTGEYSHLPPAIILDVDETVLDHAAYQARLVKAHEQHSVPKFIAWLAENKSEAVPGSVEFLNHAHDRGVTIFFVSNAESEENQRLNLARLGFPLETSFDTVLSRADRKEWDSSNKTTRRAYVASKYRVIFMFGDDLNDFVATSGLTLEQRAVIVHQHVNDWGMKWFIIPNPMYGSWESAAMGSPSPKTEEERLQRKYERLDTKQ